MLCRHTSDAICQMRIHSDAKVLCQIANYMYSSGGHFPMTFADDLSSVQLITLFFLIIVLQKNKMQHEIS